MADDLDEGIAIEEKIQYPLDVQYCGVCSMPLEYCEFSAEYEKCKEWWKSNHPDIYEELINQATAQMASLDAGDGSGKKRQTRGGRAVKGPKKKSVPKKVTISRAQRNKKKYVTVVTGLGTFDIDLKKAAKQFAQRFSCGSSVTGDDEIVIQGDITDDIFDFIQEKWPQIDDDSIDDLGDQKRSS